MILSAIACTDKDGGIGKDNSIPWKNAEDMRFFKEKTEGHLVLIGSKTYWSLPEKFRPLPNRALLVYTSDRTQAIYTDYRIRKPESVVFTTDAKIVDGSRSIIENLAKIVTDTYGNTYSADEVFIIGGASVYAQFMPYIDRLYLNVLPDAYGCDTFFPPIDPKLTIAQTTPHVTFQSRIYERE